MFSTMTVNVFGLQPVGYFSHSLQITNQAVFSDCVVLRAMCDHRSAWCAGQGKMDARKKTV